MRFWKCLESETFMGEGLTSIKEFFEEPSWWQKILGAAINIALTVIIVIIIIKLTGRIFKKHLKSKEKIHLRFLENIIKAAAVVFGVLWILLSFDATRSFGTVLFQGTAVIAAIIGFAAQPVLSDLLCGFMMSMNKPFEIGDRIVVDGLATGQVSGIVKDITVRHVVIESIDTATFVIPNSKLNSATIMNMSFKTKFRSIMFKFSVAYGSDVEKVKNVIRKVVEDCPLTVPGKPTENGSEYGPVYFLEYAESSLTMVTTVYYEPNVPTEAVFNAINTAVDKAFRENDIEVPFKYVNVVLNEQEVRYRKMTGQTGDHTVQSGDTEE